MKRVFIVVLVVALSMGLLSACMSAEDEQDGAVATETEGAADTTHDINTLKMDWDIIDWDSPYGTYKEAVVPNKEVAVEIATAIFNGINVSQEVRKANLCPQAVAYNEEEEIWLVLFGAEPVDGMYSTMGYNIAIQKSDGKVVRIWRD